MPCCAYKSPYPLSVLALAPAGKPLISHTPSSPVPLFRGFFNNPGLDKLEFLAMLQEVSPLAGNFLSKYYQNTRRIGLFIF